VKTQIVYNRLIILFDQAIDNHVAEPARGLIAQASETVEASIAPFGVFVDKDIRFVEQ